MGEKPGVSLAIVGPQGCGKTTALAQICQALGAFPEEEHRDCRELARELGAPAAEHAWMLDRLADERELGSSMEPRAAPAFESEGFRYVALDTPGRQNLAKSLLSVTSLADAAVLVVPAAVGEYEECLESGRIRELALCCFTMGIKHIVVWVSKMDDPSVKYSMARYDEIKKTVGAFVKEVGYKAKEPPFIPISGALNENLITKSGEMTWYGGPPALDALDALGPINRPAEKPLRLPVLKVHEVGGETIVVGRVETGQLRTGIKVIFSPGGRVAEVVSIEQNNAEVPQVNAGDIASFSVGDAIEASDLRRGMVASSQANDPAADAESFTAQVIILDHPRIRAGYCPSIAVHTAQVPCEIEELLSKIDKKTGKEAEQNPEEAKTGEVVMARLRPRAPLCVEVFGTYAPLGRFAIRDHNRTIAVGVVKEVTKRPIPKIKSGNENQYFDG